MRYSNITKESYEVNEKINKFLYELIKYNPTLRMPYMMEIPENVIRKLITIGYRIDRVYTFRSLLGDVLIKVSDSNKTKLIYKYRIQ